MGFFKWVSRLGSKKAEKIEQKRPVTPTPIVRPFRTAYPSYQSDDNFAASVIAGEITGDPLIGGNAMGALLGASLSESHHHSDDSNSGYNSGNDNSGNNYTPDTSTPDAIAIYPSDSGYSSGGYDSSSNYSSDSSSYDTISYDSGGSSDW